MTNSELLPLRQDILQATSFLEGIRADLVYTFRSSTVCHFALPVCLTFDAGLGYPHYKAQHYKTTNPGFVRKHLCGMTLFRGGV